jgi:hypothetical protein
MPVAKGIVMFAGFPSYKWFLPRCGFTLWLFFTAAQAQMSESTASLRGIVTNASGGGGLRKAYLRLSPVIGSNGGASFTAVAHDQGAFAIENIAPGDYRLDAECTGFLDTQYGGGSTIRGVSIRLSGGDKLTGIEIKMTPQAVLSGRVLDQDGDLGNFQDATLSPEGVQLRRHRKARKDSVRPVQRGEQRKDDAP